MNEKQRLEFNYMITLVAENVYARYIKCFYVQFIHIVVEMPGFNNVY